LNVATRGNDRGHGTKKDAGRQRDRKRKRQDAPVQAYGICHRQIRSGQDAHGAHGNKRQQQARDPTQQRKHHAFGQDLTHDSQPAGPKRRADGNFPLAHGGAGEEHVGRVGAGDQQHEAHSDQQQD
jgi:hypothetical protein